MGSFKVALMIHLMRVYIMCTDRILMDSEKKETGRPSFIYKENANELEPAIINLQTTNKYT